MNGHCPFLCSYIQGAGISAPPNDAAVECAICSGISWIPPCSCFFVFPLSTTIANPVKGLCLAPPHLTQRHQTLLLSKMSASSPSICPRRIESVADVQKQGAGLAAVSAAAPPSSSTPPLFSCHKFRNILRYSVKPSNNHKTSSNHKHQTTPSKWRHSLDCAPLACRRSGRSTRGSRIFPDHPLTPPASHHTR
jgi:hypothetical protein